MDKTIEEISEEEYAKAERRKYIQREFKDAVVLAQALIEDYPDIVRVGSGDQQNIYMFNGRCYDLMTDKDLEALYLKFIMKYGITQAWKNKYLVISAFLNYPTVVRVEKMNDYENLMCLNNGILNIHTKEFIQHSPEYYFDSCINIDYDPEANKCPVFVSYLNNTFNNDQETITNIIRLGGYLLDTNCTAERMFLFDGNGANGKSVLINTFQLFFTEDQITPLSLDKLASDSFSKELLIKSRVNFCAEQKKGFLDAEELKKIITGDRMEINRKFKIALSFTPKVKIISASNGLPTFSDRSHAIFRRILIIRFKNQYLNELEYSRVKYPERMNIFKKDKTLFEKIKEEKSAILNLFIGGLVDLRSNNYEFIESRDSMIAMDEFKKDSDTVREFLEDNYEFSEENKVSLREIYEHYRDWYHFNVQDGGSIKFRINEMGKRIKDVFGVESTGREYVFSGRTQRSERETMYPIELIKQEADIVQEIKDNFGGQEVLDV